jgi:hypothetical protein
VFQMDVATVDRDVTYAILIIHVCYELLLSMFHLFFQRMLQVCLSEYCIYFHIYIASVLSRCCVCFTMVSSVVQVFCKCFRLMF